MYNSGRNFGCRLDCNYCYDGLRVVLLENDLLRVGVLADKGADIYECIYKPCDLDVLWRSRLGIRNPSRISMTAPHPSGIFGDFYEGGWQELFPSASGSSVLAGAPLGEHGEVFALPWTVNVVEDSPKQVSVTFEATTIRTPFRLERRMTLKHGESILHIQERVYNESQERLPYIWGHHPAFNLREIGLGARLDVPARAAWQGSEDGLCPIEWPMCVVNGDKVNLSTMEPPEARVERMFFLGELESPWYALVNPERKFAVGMSWDLKVFSYVWVWQMFGSRGYPWFGEAYTIAVEPFTSLVTKGVNGLAEAEGTKTLRWLLPGEQVEADLCLTIATGLSEVHGIERDGSIF